MTTPTLQVAGFNRDAPYSKNFEGKLLIELLLSRPLTTVETRLAKAHDLEFAKDSRYTLVVRDTAEISEEISNINQRLASLEAAGAEQAERERLEREEAVLRSEQEDERIRQALVDAGVEPVNPLPTSREW